MSKKMEDLEMFYGQQMTNLEKTKAKEYEITKKNPHISRMPKEQRSVMKKWLKNYRLENRIISENIKQFGMPESWLDLNKKYQAKN